MMSIAQQMAGCTLNLEELDCNLHGAQVFSSYESCYNFKEWGGRMRVNAKSNCYIINSELNSTNFDMEAYLKTRKISILPYDGSILSGGVETLPMVDLSGLKLAFSAAFSEGGTAEYSQLVFNNSTKETSTQTVSRSFFEKRNGVSQRVNFEQRSSRDSQGELTGMMTKRLIYDGLDVAPKQVKSTINNTEQVVSRSFIELDGSLNNFYQTVGSSVISATLKNDD